MLFVATTVRSSPIGLCGPAVTQVVPAAQPSMGGEKLRRVRLCNSAEPLEAHQSGAAFPALDLGLALEPREDHTASVASWLAVLCQDNPYAVSAVDPARR